MKDVARGHYFISIVLWAGIQPLCPVWTRCLPVYSPGPSSQSPRPLNGAIVPQRDEGGTRAPAPRVRGSLIRAALHHMGNGSRAAFDVQIMNYRHCVFIIKMWKQES